MREGEREREGGCCCCQGLWWYVAELEERETLGEYTLQALPACMTHKLTNDIVFFLCSFFFFFLFCQDKFEDFFLFKDK